MFNIKLLAFIIIAILGHNIPLKAQILGCTDPNATNYNSNANSNDGSCIYNTTSYAPQQKFNLTNTLAETSALLFWNNYFWTINDGGNSPKIFKLDTINGQILDSFVIKNVANTDWEAMAQDPNFLYIGDFGNNLGTRQNLQILKIAKSDILSSNSDSLTASIISFHYPEQSNFNPNNQNTAWDAEAFIWQNNALHIFTKNWSNGYSSHYQIPDIPGNYPAQFIDSFNVKGLITDATIDPTTGNLVLLGYTKGTYNAFAWLLFDYQNSQYFSGNKRRLELGSTLILGQTEGICFTNSYSGYISNEQIVNTTLGISITPNIYHFNFDSYLNANNSTSIENIHTKRNIFNIYPNSHASKIQIEMLQNGHVSIYDIKGNLKMRDYLSKGINVIDCQSWSNGNYYICSSNNNCQIFIKL